MNPILMGSSFLGGVIGRLVFTTNFRVFKTNCLELPTDFYGFATIQMVFPTNSQVFTTIRSEADKILL